MSYVTVCEPHQPFFAPNCHSKLHPEMDHRFFFCTSVLVTIAPCMRELCLLWGIPRMRRLNVQKRIPLHTQCSRILNILLLNFSLK
jgi:hypothetical protein